METYIIILTLPFTMDIFTKILTILLLITVCSADFMRILQEGKPANGQRTIGKGSPKSQVSKGKVPKSQVSKGKVPNGQGSQGNSPDGQGSQGNSPDGQGQPVNPLGKLGNFNNLSSDQKKVIRNSLKSQLQDRQQ